MSKTVVRKMFGFIFSNDVSSLDETLNSAPDLIEAVGFHNRLVRDKTPLMYSMQCSNLQLAHSLLDRGANASAIMPGGPKTPVLGLCVQFAYADRAAHDRWLELAERLLDLGADPGTALWPALHSFGRVVTRIDLVELLLKRGADPDIRVGDSGSSVRELVLSNRSRYPAEVLDLLGVPQSSAHLGAAKS